MKNVKYVLGAVVVAGPFVFASLTLTGCGGANVTKSPHYNHRPCNKSDTRSGVVLEQSLPPPELHSNPARPACQ